MSGGSWDYMYLQEAPSNELLEDMADRLLQLAEHCDNEFVRGLLKDAAKKTEALIRDPIPEWLTSYWKEVEWLDSCDSSLDTFYRNLETIEGL